MVGRYPTLIKELNAESPQFRRLNDFKSRRQVGFSVAEDAARAGSWPTAAETCRRVATAWPQLADTRPSTLRAGVRYQWRRAAQFSRSHSLTPSPALALASAAEPPWLSWPPPRPPASGLPHVHPCAPPAPPPSS